MRESVPRFELEMQALLHRLVAFVGMGELLRMGEADLLPLTAGGAIAGI